MALAQLAVMSLRSQVNDLRARFEEHGQGHVFQLWPGLDGDSRAFLAAQAARIDLAGLARAFARARGPAGPPPAEELEPAPIERLPGPDEPDSGVLGQDRRRARECGEQLLAEGRAAALVVAGGQGTRLGHPGPKGGFPIGPVSSRSLFALHAQRLRGLGRRFGRPVPWYVMTSEATDADTRALFAREACYGLDPGDVTFFRQAQLPVVDPEGRILLESPSRIAEAPDGHGGVIPALRDSGALSQMESRGIQVISYAQVDNPLIPLGDPVLLGFHRMRNSEMSSKAVAKREPGERVGTLACWRGRARVVEYTEIQEPARSARDPRGELIFWAGAIGAHAFDVDFLKRVAPQAETALPHHPSPKRVTTLDAQGRARTPAEPNGIKLERFVFDALPLAERPTLLEVARGDEYSPVKNADGGETPETARRDLTALYRRWLAAADVTAPPDGDVVEIDHSQIDGPDELRRRGVRRFDEAGSAIQHTPSGVTA